MSKTPHLTILYHRQLRRLGQRAHLRALDHATAAEVSRRGPDFFGDDGSHGPLEDPHVSKRPFSVLRGADGRYALEAPADLTGVNVEGTPLVGRRELSAAEVARGVVIEINKAVTLLFHLHDGDRVDADDLGLVGRSNAIAEVRRAVRTLSRERDPVLIRGENGTGKELVARALVMGSGAPRGAPYIAFNAGTLGDTSLAVAQLFGYVKGSHATAYADAPGLFQRSHGGTLFLDEVGELPRNVQVALLRVLQEKRVQRLGAATDEPADPRLIFATDADLEAAVASGRMGRPFYERIAVHQIFLPPLRERREDVSVLLFHFLQQELALRGDASPLDERPPEASAWINGRLVAELVRHPWPGNVRALLGVAKHLVVQYRHRDRVDPRDPRLQALITAVPRHDESPDSWTDAQWLSELRRQDYAIARLAKALELPENTVRDRLKRCDGYLPVSGRPKEELEQICAEEGWAVPALVHRLQASESAIRVRLRQLGLDPARLRSP